MKPKLTKAGTPRKRAPGAGRPNAGRTASLPRVRPEAHDAFKRHAEKNGLSLAEAIEDAADRLKA
jgi:hypothetical protein